MGSDYYFYTEARLGATWYGIDPRVLRLERFDRPMAYQLHATYWNGSRSYFSDTFHKLYDISRPIRLEDTSAEFRMSRAMVWLGNEQEIAPYYDNILRVFSFADLLSLKPEKDSHAMHGLYHKDRIALFEQGAIEDLWEEDITPEAYSKLADEARKVYQYYEWDDPMSWQHYIPILIQKVGARVDEFEDVNFNRCDEVRVIMYESC